MNAFTFYFLSRNVLQMLGSRRFILLYLGGELWHIFSRLCGVMQLTLGTGGMISSFTSMFYAMATNKAGYMSHGASGVFLYPDFFLSNFGHKILTK